MLEVFTLARRDLKKFWKSRFSLLSTFFRPLAWLVLFGKAFNPLKLVSGGSNVSLNLGGAPDYFSFMAAGMLSIMMFTISMRGMSSIMLDRYLGFLDKVLVSPVRREYVLLSKVIASIVRGLLQALVLLVIAVLLGMTLGSGLGFIQILGVLAVLLALGVGLSAVFTAMGSLIRRWETSESLLTLITFPVMFTSSVLYPVRTMPWWLQPIAVINPLTHAAELLRWFLYGGASASQVLLDGEMLGGFVLAAVAILFLASRQISSSR